LWYLRGQSALIKQAAVVMLSIVPFAVSVLFAYATWEAIAWIGTVWRMIAMTAVWIAAFALGTQLFWKVTGLLVPKQQ
jgi:hypothetical protein